LFVSFVTDRALNKAAPILSQYGYDTGNATVDRRVRAMVNEVLSSRLVSSCVPQQSFDESVLFTEMATVRSSQRIIIIIGSTVVGCFLIGTN
jgi:hypothetical protein